MIQSEVTLHSVRSPLASATHWRNGDTKYSQTKISRSGHIRVMIMMNALHYQKISSLHLRMRDSSRPKGGFNSRTSVYTVAGMKKKKSSHIKRFRGRTVWRDPTPIIGGIRVRPAETCHNDNRVAPFFSLPVLLVPIPQVFDER